MEQGKNWRFCVSGNIVKSHLDEEGVIRYGTKAFTGGTKVYIDGKFWSDVQTEVDVIGKNRFGRFVIERVPIALIENIRSQRVYNQTVLEIMNYVEWVDNWNWWGRTAADRRETVAFAKRIDKIIEEENNDATGRTGTQNANSTFNTGIRVKKHTVYHFGDDEETGGRTEDDDVDG